MLQYLFNNNKRHFLVVDGDNLSCVRGYEKLIIQGFYLTS